MKLPSLLPSRRTSNHSASEGETWADREVAGCEFQDVRLGERFRKLLKQIGSAIGQAIPFACQDWANMLPGLLQPRQVCSCGLPRRTLCSVRRSKD
jgi:hypothetical protein